ncbi:MAG: VWA domain-containing protein [Planctomycetia bacterium]|nr:VWA domain-containing protein [Planctomycetia bacterium]
MPALFLKLPKPVLFGFYGALGGLIGALAFGELLWYLLRPRPPEKPPEQPPPAQLAITVSEFVEVYPGGKNTLNVQIARANFNEPVTVKFEASKLILTASTITIPPGETSGKAEVVADPKGWAGDYTITATASAKPDGQPLSASGTIKVKVLPLPPEPPRLAVSVSPKIQVYQRGKNTFEVKVLRGAFNEEVTVAFDNLPDGVKVPPVTIPAGQSEGKVDLTAEGDAKPGAQPVMVSATAKPGGINLVAQAQTNVEVKEGLKAPLDIVFALDITGGMQWTINGTSGGIEKFATELNKAQFDVRVGLVGFQATTLGQPNLIMKFGDEKLTKDFAKFRDEVGMLKTRGGGDEGESSLDGVADSADFPFREPSTKVIILITDEGPKRPDSRMPSIEETAKYIKEKKIDQIHIVTRPELKEAFSPLWAGARGKYFDLDAVANGKERFDKLLPDLAQAMADLVPDRPVGKPELPAAPPTVALPPLPVVELPVDAAEEAPSPKLEPVAKSVQAVEESAIKLKGWLIARNGVWMGVIAALVCCVLVAGQKNYLQGGFPFGGMLAGLGGGLLIGLVGGSAGPGLFLLTETDNKFLAGLFHVLGWALVGGMAGVVLSRLIPNLGVLLGLLTGVVGGAIAALGFIGISEVAEEQVGRVSGGVLLGLFIGLLVAGGEVVFRRAWLEVSEDEGEPITVTLGSQPVEIGSDSEECAVWARGAPDVALRFFIHDGRIVCEDLVNDSEMKVADGFSRTVGSVTVVVRTGEGSAADSRARPRSKPAKAHDLEDDWEPIPAPVKTKSAPTPNSAQPLDLDDEPMPLPLPPPPAAPLSAPSPKPKPTPTARPVVPSAPTAGTKPAMLPAPSKPGRPSVPVGKKPTAPTAPTAPSAPVSSRPTTPAGPTKPNISSAPKPGDGCPKCGRKIPGEIGKRYCMLCDVTF